MTRRMVDASIWANESFAELPAMARLLLIGIITLADDQGRLKANPAFLRSQVFPYDDVALCDIETWLDTMAHHETISLYTVDGKTYLQLLNWWSYQSFSFAWPSPHPRPGGWLDRLRFTKGGTTYTYNWISAKGDRLPNTCDEYGNPLSSNGLPPAQKDDSPPGNPHGEPRGSPRGNPREAPSEPSILNLYLPNTNTNTSPPPPTPSAYANGNNDGGGGGGEILEKEQEIAAVLQCWRDNMQDDPTDEIKPVIAKELKTLVLNTSGRSVIHGITTAVGNKSKKFGYVLSCATNHFAGKPPPRPPGSVSTIPPGLREHQQRKNQELLDSRPDISNRRLITNEELARQGVATPMQKADLQLDRRRQQEEAQQNSVQALIAQTAQKLKL